MYLYSGKKAVNRKEMCFDSVYDLKGECPISV